MIELPMQHNGIINMNEISDTKNGVANAYFHRF